MPPTVVAIFASDIHLCTNPPTSRSAEPCWFDAMARPLKELAAVQRDNGNPPIIYAGDVFDKWNSPPELINFAIKHLPMGYAVPGQHDLPNHRYVDIERTAYWTLVENGTLQNLPPDEPVKCGLLRLWGVPWGHSIPAVSRTSSKWLDVAVVHAYIWEEGYGYNGAEEEKRVGVYRKELEGYVAAAFGDNHMGFLSPGKDGTPTIMNCGGFMCRTSAEVGYSPQIGLMMSDGSVVPHYLNTAEDRWGVAKARETEQKDLPPLMGMRVRELLNDLEDLGATGIDFVAIVKECIHAGAGVSHEVRDIILRAIGHGG